MINLRFHIVSIVAVFLALAVGIFTGTTLLDRVTVDYLKASRDRVDERNGELETEREQLLSILDRFDSQMDDFDTQVIDNAFEGELDGVQVLLIASDGVDPTGVRSVQDTYISAGAASYGIIWLDERLDLTNTARLNDVADAIGIESPGSDEDLAKAVRYALGLSISLATTPSGDLDGDGQIGDGELPSTSQTLPVDTEPDSETSGSANPEDPAVDSASYWAALADSGLLDWDSPEGKPTSLPLPSSDLRVVMISGRDPVLANDTLIYPLINQVSTSKTPLIVGEMDEVIPSSEEPELEVARGAFVNQIRSDEALSELVVTIDNLDKPFGRVASLMVLSGLSDNKGRAYGEANTAERSFPAAAQQDS